MNVENLVLPKQCFSSVSFFQIKHEDGNESGSENVAAAENKNKMVPGDGKTTIRVMVLVYRSFKLFSIDNKLE